MGDLTLNFSKHEFECSCGCGLDDIALATVDVLQDVRDHFTMLYGGKVYIKVTSGCRCLEWNRVPVEEGGPGSNDNSQHPKCTAADFIVNGVESGEVRDLLYDWFPRKHGIGSYDDFTHFDTRGERARW